MKRILALCVALFCLMCGAAAADGYDASRTEHGIGSCRSLSQDAAIVILFAKDDVSSWDEASMNEVYRRVEEAAQLFRDTAASYGYELTIPVYCYGDNENREIRYSGVIETGGEKLDALAGIARNWGFADEQEMHEALQKHIGMEQLAYVVAHNKDGYSYAQGQSHKGTWIDWADPEYCVIAIRTQNGSVNPAAVYAHEMLHMFGAQDFYRKDFGDVIYNETRAELCRTLCPNAIMLDCYQEMADVQVSGFTAYCVGWIDFLPGNYNVRGWWEGTQWEDNYLP